MASFGERLSDLMEERGVNSHEMQNETGITNSLISAWKRTEMSPRLSSLVKLSEYFDCSIDFLTGRSETRVIHSSANPVSFSARVDFLMKKNGATQYRIGKELRFNNANFSKWRNGKEPSLFLLIKLADYFGVSIDYLVGRTDFE